MIDIQGALAAWIKVLSKKNVIIKRNILSEFETATFLLSKKYSQSYIQLKLKISKNV